MLGDQPHSKRFFKLFSAETPGPGPAESELGLPAPWDSGWRWSDLVGLALPGIQKKSLVGGL